MISKFYINGTLLKLKAIIVFSVITGINGYSQTIVRYPQGSHSPDIVNSNVIASDIIPNSGINEVDCGGYISAENFDQTSYTDALNNNEFWQFTVTPNSGYDLDITNLTVLRTGSDREDPEPLMKRAYLYKIMQDDRF